ncbi:TGF-beta-activated kinase 1 and MAP3K7-binding protein 1 [Hyalella azteca]|uniref:TGF-beta-activated kinase 1 and MAP3K7-binding protein 1 n=1 Tax=Hyalella azteca TaxID=294128 RepID=A0A8B7PDY3_HYAAZ|nr:TGF-beta-activated kinase 1 and MAP3K7-binding protein 1 [Hyalella azteca]
MPSPVRPARLDFGISGYANNDIWTDGLPICPLSGVGMSANQMYREDGTPCSAHEYEDRSIHFCLDRENQTYLYAVFDGHDGAKAAYFASQRLPAELSFEQITPKSSREKVREVFATAFHAVEEAFLESIDHCIAERTQLLDKIPEDMPQVEAARKFPETLDRLQELEKQIRCGTTAVVALIHAGVLYVGNLGDSRALLCKKDKCGVLKVKQLSRDHTTSSHEELQRLAALGLHKHKIEGVRLGNHEITRCIGNYFLKGGYKEFDILSPASAEPVISVPHIDVVPIDDSCSFLLLMSDGLYKSYQEATGSQQVNKEIAQMVVEQFVEQATITSVAQTVVDKVVRLHHDRYLTQQNNFSGRDDITLVIRNFSFRLRGPCSGSRSPAGALAPGPSCALEPPLAESRDAGSSEEEGGGETVSDVCTSQQTSLHSSSNASIFHTSSTESSDVQRPSLNPLQLDEDGRIVSYVSFTPYYQALREANKKGIISDTQLQLYL